MTGRLADYVAKVQADFPTLGVQSARLNSDGMMNDVLVLNEDLVFRFAKNEAAQRLLAYEARLLDLIGRYVSLAVPRIEHCTDAYMHYRLLVGRPLYRHLLLRSDEQLQSRLAQQLATFLRELHAVPWREAPDPPWQQTGEAESQRTFYQRRLEALERELYPLLWADQKAWIEDLYAPILDGRVDLDAFTPVLIHRDLASYHILYDDREGQLMGVIDFGTAGAGDAAVDWGCLINTYGEHFVQRMHQFYPVSQATMDRARFFAAAIELEWALNGVHSNDLSLLLVHLGRARDSVPILTPWSS